MVTGSSLPMLAEAEDESGTIDEVIVTGTRRQGMTVDDSPAPVQVVTAAALGESAAPDLMNQLAFQVPSLNASQQGTDMASATLVANMRALSPNHTLVLVNGKSYRGKLGTVGSDTVLVTQIVGKEFYDVLIDLDAVAAVEVRVRGN